MPTIIFESTEDIRGRLTRGGEWIAYTGLLRIKDSEKNPVSLDLTFVPPHPLAYDMPTKQSLRGESITHVYAKLIRFLRKMGVELSA